MKSILLYPGQGSQFKGMVHDICEADSAAMDVVKRASDISGENIAAFLWEIEAEELSRSDRSQLAITTASLAVTAALKTRGIEGSLFAGFSLGEFAALCSSGVLSFDDTIRVVAERGRIMQRTCENIAAQSGGNPPGMAAVIGLSPDAVKAAIAPISGSGTQDGGAQTGSGKPADGGAQTAPGTQNGTVFAVNLNSPKQTVIAGTADGLDKAEALLKEAGARRVIRLKVAGPFHSPLMAQGAKEFEQVLSSVTFNNPSHILLSNVTGAVVVSGAEAASNAVLHFTNPVRWTDEEAVIAQHIRSWKADGSSCRIIEAGAGTVLAGLWRDSGCTDECGDAVSCGTLADFSKL